VHEIIKVLSKTWSEITCG